MKKYKKQIFESLKEIILESECAIHKEMIKNAYSGYCIKNVKLHLDTIKRIEKTKNMDQLVKIMEDKFSMSYDELFTTYII